MTPEEWFKLPAGTLIRGCESILDETCGYYFLTPSLKKWSLVPIFQEPNTHPSPYYSEGIYFLSEGFENGFSMLNSKEAMRTFKSGQFSTRNICRAEDIHIGSGVVIWDEVIHINQADQTKIVGMLLGKHCIGVGPLESPVICSSILTPSGKTWALMLTTKPNTGEDLVLYY